MLKNSHLCFLFSISLWAICVLIGNHPKNVKRLLSCTSDDWTEYSVKKFLQSITNSKGQTTEARDHASLICCSIKMYEMHKFPQVNIPEEHMLTSDGAENGSTRHSFNSSGLVRLKKMDTDASEYIYTLRGSNGTITDSLKYSQSAFPELNSEPFFRFNIVGVQHHAQCGSFSTLDSVVRVELKGVTEI